MILVMIDNEINTRATQALIGNSEEKHTTFQEDSVLETNDNSLTILDLSGNGSFQDCYAADLLADYLIQAKLSQAVQSISLLVSDINIKSSMTVYASDLANAFATTHNRKLQINIIASKYHLATCIIPPTNKEGQWALYGTNSTSITNQISAPFKHGLDWFLAQKDKIALLWQGNNLSDVFKTEYGMVFNTKKNADVQLNDNPNTYFSNKRMKIEAKSETSTPSSLNYSSSDDENFLKAKETLNVISKKSQTLDFLLSLGSEQCAELLKATQEAQAIFQANSSKIKSGNSQK